MPFNSDENLNIARSDLAALHRIANSLGWNESIVNHMTFMAPGRDDVYLLMPYGLHWGEVQASDFLVIDMAGEVVSGSGTPEISAISLHGPVHRRLPQARCVLHTHQPNITALTALKDQTLLMVHQDATLFHGITKYISSYGDLPQDSRAGEAVADALGDALVLLMANHGPMVVGPTVAQTFQTLYYLDRIAKVQMAAFATGRALELIPDELAEKMHPIVKGIYLGREAELHFEAQKRILDYKCSDYRK